MRSVCRCLLLAVATVAVPALAQQTDSLWQDTAVGQQVDAATASLLPESVSYQRAIEIDAGTLSTLDSVGEIVAELLPTEFRSFQFGSSRDYLNGDTGWSGTASDGGPIASLSIVYNATTVLASVNTGDARYSIRAIRTSLAEASYTGYLYSQDGLGVILATDQGGVVSDTAMTLVPSDDEPTAVFAISGNDVTIEQDISPSQATVGDVVDITITVTNNTSSTLADESLEVLFVLDQSELVFSSANCAATTVDSEVILDCSLPDIAPAASTDISYTVRLTDDSYPYINNAAFVGDAFGSEYVRDDAFIDVNRDTLTDSDGDGQSDFNEAIVNTDPDNAASVLPTGSLTEIDLMFLYTRDFVNDIGGVAPETKINELVEITNGYFANSRTDVIFRPVLYRRVGFNVGNNLDSAFDALETESGLFSFVSETRSAVGADIVVLIDGVISTDSFCGIGSTSGVGLSGELFHPLYSNPELYVVMYTDGFPRSGDSGCDDITLAHELGHNHGLNHSHREAGSGATFTWAFGHGVDGSFATIMANPDNYPGSENIPLFSNPQSTDCNGLPCGISRSDVEQGADAVFTINHTRFQIANRRQSRILPITSLAGTSNLIMYGAATLSSAPDTPLTRFNANDSLDVRATLGIPLEHQGTVGETYVVISIADLGLFFRDATGSYQSWDGELTTLQPGITARPLNATEELIAFENFVPSMFDVTSANITAFFAYAIPGTEIFVYSSDGLNFTIQP